MTEVCFYHNAPDRLRVACVLAGKAHGNGRRIVVFAPDGGMARQFDQMLWSFQPLAFVPHVAAGSPLAAETRLPRTLIRSSARSSVIERR